MKANLFVMLFLAASMGTNLSQVSAVPITGLFNTGLGVGGSYLAAGGLDNHYTASGPSGAFTPVAVDDTAWPFPPWFANNNPNSRWIGPDISSNGPAGNYSYQTTFSLPSNANLTTAMISGVWGTDDGSLDIWLNGTSQGQVSAGFTSLVPFMVNSGFVVGPNVLEFRLNNAGGPTGLRVDDIRGKYDLVPEPTSLGLVAGCLTGVLAIRRRPRR